MVKVLETMVIINAKEIDIIKKFGKKTPNWIIVKQAPVA
jgi:hypothetical protein